jgi:hypothetical protein
MSVPGQADDDLAGPIRTIQIMAAAIVAGVGMFLIIVLTLRGQGPAPAASPILLYVGIVFGVAALAARLVVPNLLVAARRRQLPGSSSSRDLLGLFQLRTIVGMALLEGAAFFLVIVYLLDGSQLALLLSILGVVIVASQFPTRSSIDRWLARQRELIEQEQQLGP